jgi:hypothetical protein
VPTRLGLSALISLWDTEVRSTESGESARAPRRTGRGRREQNSRWGRYNGNYEERIGIQIHLDPRGLAAVGQWKAGALHGPFILNAVKGSLHPRGEKIRGPATLAAAQPKAATQPGRLTIGPQVANLPHKKWPNSSGRCAAGPGTEGTPNRPRVTKSMSLTLQVGIAKGGALRRPRGCPGPQKTMV